MNSFAAVSASSGSSKRLLSRYSEAFAISNLSVTPARNSMLEYIQWAIYIIAGRIWASKGKENRMLRLRSHRSNNIVAHFSYTSGLFLIVTQPCRSALWYSKRLNIFSLLPTFSRTKRHPMIIFPDLSNVQVEGVEVAEEIILTLRTTSPTASCPSCGTVSSRIQSRYTRKLRDLPTVGRPILLILHVRRFFCKRSTCAQKIFVERLPDLCRPHAQRTKRLQEALRQLGLKV